MINIDIKCDWDNCSQGYLKEPNSWWMVWSDSDTCNSADQDIIHVAVLGKKEYDQIIENEVETEKHYCCIDHAIKGAARLMELQRASIAEASIPAMTDTEIDIPF